MNYSQKNQTKSFFETEAKNWSIKSNFKNKVLNTIQERNYYVLSQLKNLKLKSLLDVGCGTGDLCYEASKYTSNVTGIDFSDNMINLAKNNFNKKNIKFISQDFLNHNIDQKFECISANGFIEYLSINDIKKFLRVSRKYLKKNGVLIFGSRNRLFNLYSLNKFSENEIKKKTFKKFYEESILLNNYKFKNFIKIKKNKFGKAFFNQPKTGINVDVRHQFSPLQILDLLSSYKYKAIDFHPINFHPVPPSKFNNSKEFKKFSNSIYFLKEENKLPYIPYSSSFMVTAKPI